MTEETPEPPDRSAHMQELNQILTKDGYLDYEERIKILMVFMGSVEAMLEHFEQLAKAAPHEAAPHIEQARIRLEDAWLRMDQASRLIIKEMEEEAVEQARWEAEAALAQAVAEQEAEQEAQQAAEEAQPTDSATPDQEEDTSS